jgi:hypothetical protein
LTFTTFWQTLNRLLKEAGLSELSFGEAFSLFEWCADPHRVAEAEIRAHRAGKE